MTSANVWFGSALTLTAKLLNLALCLRIFIIYRVIDCNKLILLICFPAEGFEQARQPTVL